MESEHGEDSGGGAPEEEDKNSITGEGLVPATRLSIITHTSANNVLREKAIVTSATLDTARLLLSFIMMLLVTAGLWVPMLRTARIIPIQPCLV